ncbi:hypothetical protein Tco_1169873 [Tanacetum coccineum]
MSWGWRKILQLHTCIRDFIWHEIGDGWKTFLWFDHWCDVSPLADSISSRDMFQAGFNLSTKDRLIWRDGNGNQIAFKVSSVWSFIRPRGEKVDSNLEIVGDEEHLLGFKVDLMKDDESNDLVLNLVEEIRLHYLDIDLNVAMIKTLNSKP